MVCLGSCEIDEKSWDGKVRSRRLQVVSYFEFYFHYYDYDYDYDYDDSL